MTSSTATIALLLTATVLIATACGVRNDPIPPKDFPGEQVTLPEGEP